MYVPSQRHEIPLYGLGRKLSRIETPQISLYIKKTKPLCGQITTSFIIWPQKITNTNK